MNPEQFQSWVIHWPGSWFLLGFTLCWIFLTLANQKWVDRVTRNDFAGVYGLAVLAAIVFVLLIMPYTNWALLGGIVAFVMLILLISWWYGRIKRKINAPKQASTKTTPKKGGSKK